MYSLFYRLDLCLYRQIKKRKHLRCHSGKQRPSNGPSTMGRQFTVPFFCSPNLTHLGVAIHMSSGTPRRCRSAIGRNEANPALAVEPPRTDMGKDPLISDLQPLGMPTLSEPSALHKAQGDVDRHRPQFFVSSPLPPFYLRRVSASLLLQHCSSVFRPPILSI